MKILVIDDSSFQRKTICSIIDSVGHETVQASNGADGLAQLENNDFDCIFCDLLMPNMTGNEFLDHVREKNIQTPVVILTADKQQTSMEKALEQGAAKVLNKPPRAEDIESTIQEVVGKSS
jgi:CheY-like chemotaxis protein